LPKFKDINTYFYSNDGLVTTTDVDAINNSINNIIFTKKGEKVGDPNFGTNISSLLFELMSDINSTLIESEILDAIEFYERRINIEDLEVVPDYDTNSYSIKIIYTIVSTPDSKQSFVTVLKRL